MSDSEKHKHLIRRHNSRRIVASTFVLAILIGLFAVHIPPFKAFNGVIWLKSGVHYLSNTQIADKIAEINAPKEAELAKRISASTRSCSKVSEGFCQQTKNNYVYKTLIVPSVKYKPGTPDRKVIVGYCTLCNDGTFSPSCAVGRGACSWHRGVASYNVAEYQTIPGTPAVQAQSAVYDYTSKSFKDSQLYQQPETPTLQTVVGY